MPSSLLYQKRNAPLTSLHHEESETQFYSLLLDKVLHNSSKIRKTKFFFKFSLVFFYLVTRDCSVVACKIFSFSWVVFFSKNKKKLLVLLLAWSSQLTSGNCSLCLYLSIIFVKMELWNFYHVITKHDYAKFQLVKDWLLIPSPARPEVLGFFLSECVLEVFFSLLLFGCMVDTLLFSLKRLLSSWLFSTLKKTSVLPLVWIHQMLLRWSPCSKRVLFWTVFFKEGFYL